MQKKSGNAALKHLVYSSLMLPGIFLVVFALFILAQFVHVPFISSRGPALLVVSNLLFLIIIVLRFLFYAKGMRQELRYDADQRPQNGGVIISRPVDRVRTDLVAGGYSFDQAGSYGEKHNLAHLGATLIYGGLLLALLVGTFDYLRQYSGAVFQGIGVPMDLSDRRGYFSVVKGPLASTSGLPQMQVRQQILPNAQWPKGATEIALLKKNGTVLTTGTMGASGGKPLKYDGFEYHFNRFLYDAMFAIKTSNGHIEFDDMIKMQPMKQPVGGYTFSSRFLGERYRWTALFNPATKGLRLIALDPKGVQMADGEIVFQKEQNKQIGSFDVQFGAMSHWSEMHIVRSRHMYLLVLGMLIMLAGALLRLVYRPQRVWLDTAPEGCRAWVTGKDTLNLAS